MYTKPVFFERNRVGRVYTGGKLFHEFFGDAPEDGFLPEEWIASSVVALNKELETSTEKKCILLKELGHHYTTTGDILDLSVVQNRKQERQARIWAYNKQIGLKGLIDA